MTGNGGRVLGSPGSPSQERDQRAFLAADIGAGAQLQPDVEVESGDAENVLAEHAAGAAVGQNLFDQFAQIDVFAPEIENALAGADGARRDGHALDQQMRTFGQQHPVLEGAGFALVGVADDHALVGFGIGGEFPFHAGGEAGAAAAAQSACLDGVDDAVRGEVERLLEAGIHRHRPEQDRAGMADVVVDHADRPLVRGNRAETGNRDLLGRFAGLESQRDLARLFGRQLGEDDVVDQRRRRLVAHADAGGVFERERPIGRGLADRDAQRRLECADHRLEPGIAVDDVVAQPDGDPALRFEREERIEARHAFDLNARQAGRFRDRLHGFGRDPAIAILNRVQDVHHPVRIIAEAGAYLENLRRGSRGSVDLAG